MPSKAAMMMAALQIAGAGQAGGTAQVPAEVRNESIRLVVSDRFGFGDDFLRAIGEEVVSTFAAADIRATWHRERRLGFDSGRYAWQAIVADGFLVVFSGRPPTDWGVKRRGMGRVVPGSRPPRVIVFPGRIFRVIDAYRNLGAPRAVRYNRATARALARVVVHELGHAIAPEQPHAEEGVMRGTLSRPFLQARELRIDAGSRAALIRALRARAAVDFG